MNGLMIYCILFYIFMCFVFMHNILENGSDYNEWPPEIDYQKLKVSDVLLSLIWPVSIWFTDIE